MTLRLALGCLLLMLVCVACHSVPHASILRPEYPPLLREAGITGIISFRVTFDSSGKSDMATFKVLRSPNPGFTESIRRALRSWRPDGPARRQILEDSVEFVLVRPGDDSARTCQKTHRRNVVCAVAIPQINPVVVH